MSATAKIHLVSLGCPKNLVDSERMLGLLGGHGYEVTADPLEADIVIVNTCGFIGPAKEESVEAIMAAHRLRQEGRCRGVIVTGCLSQRYEQELKKDLVEADAVLTLAQEADIVRHVDRLLGRTRSRYLDNLPRRTLTPAHWAYLRISDGCDHQCSFCAIPAIRGPHRSESMEDLVAEARRLAAAGVRELVLVSQDSVRYGRDRYGQARLVPLLEQLAQVEGIEWLRLMYTYPAFWTEEMIAFHAESPKMCRYVDMPLQHISDPVLARMKRATTRERTLGLLERLRQRIPGVGMRSSFIVGFPGETEAQFEELLAFVEESRFDNATCFIYSPEEDTAAFDLDGQHPEAVKEERYRRLTELQDRVSADINHALVGTRQTALVDGRNEDGTFSGRLERDAPEIDGQVAIDAGDRQGPELGGRFAEVEIIGAYSYELTARLAGRTW
ncbi:MAG: 30S ribosomal protein S12 methylthiotransferase RimO [Gemmatimonadota bacterium]